MAGLGRRTHYRKHLTDSIIYDYPEPGDNERIAKVVATRGGNQFDILLPIDAKDADAQQPQGQLAILPTKFNKLVWVKRNDFVIVETATAGTDVHVNSDTPKDDKDSTTTAVQEKASEDTGGIRYIISHILYKDQVKHLQSKGLWPAHDKQFANVHDVEESDIAQEGDDNDEAAEDDGIVYDQGYEDDDFMVNTNRLATLKVEDDSSDSDSD